MYAWGGIQKDSAKYRVTLLKAGSKRLLLLPGVTVDVAMCKGIVLRSTRGPMLFGYFLTNFGSSSLKSSNFSIILWKISPNRALRKAVSLIFKMSFPNHHFISASASLRETYWQFGHEACCASSVSSRSS